MLDCIHVSDSHGRLVTLQSTSAISFPKISPYTELIGNWKKLLHQFTTISSQQGNAQHVFFNTSSISKVLPQQNTIAYLYSFYGI